MLPLRQSAAGHMLPVAVRCQRCRMTIHQPEQVIPRPLSLTTAIPSTHNHDWHDYTN